MEAAVFVAVSSRIQGPRPGPLRPALGMSILVLILLAVGFSPASAQLNVLAPTFNNLNGAAVWGSAAFNTSGSGGNSKPMWRGGFAAFYGPFGGHGDSVVTFTQSVSDTSDTTVCDLRM